MRLNRFGVVTLPMLLVVFWAAASLFVLGVCSWLAHSTLSYRADLRRNLTFITGQNHLRAGVRVPPLRGFDYNGRPVSVDFGGQRGRLLVFVQSPKCGLCDGSWPQWERLRQLAQVKGIRTIFFDISDELPAGYLTQHQIPPDMMVTHVTPKAAALYRLRSSPQAVLLDSNGLALAAWPGAMTEERFADARLVLERQ